MKICYENTLTLGSYTIYYWFYTANLRWHNINWEILDRTYPLITKLSASTIVGDL